MAWKYPRYRNVDGEVMDLDAINENFETFVQEMQGQLNEHNWVGQAFISPSDYTIGACLRTKQTASLVQAMLPGAVAPGTIAMLVSGTAYQTVPVFDWDVVMTTTIRTNTATLWISASFQHAASLMATARQGIQYALRVDGIEIVETITGTGNRANDQNGEGIDGRGTNMPFVLDAIVPVIAGQHTVQLVARMCSGPSMAISANDVYWMVLNRELLVVEMH